MGVVGVADLVGHELHHLVLDGIALGILRYLFHVAAVLAVLLVLLLIGRAGPVLVFRQQTVYHHIRITADGRGEVGVVVEGQSIMSDIMHTVLRLHHGTEGDGLDGVLLTGTLGIGHQRIERLGDGTLRTTGLHLIAELRDELAQVLKFLRIRLVVDAVRQCFALSFEF